MNAQYVHLTTVHKRSDTRIALKEVMSLDRAFPGRLRLVVADGEGDATLGDGIPIIDLGALPDRRIGRALVGSWRAFRLLRAMKPEVVHIHDPELVPLGIAMKLSGSAVVYDVHEDLPRQILHKDWIPPVLRYSVATVAAAGSWVAGRAFDALACATPAIAERFPPGRRYLVQNYPWRGELTTPSPVPYGDREPCFVYVGGVTEVRGVREMIAGLGHVSPRRGVRLDIAGAFSPPGLKAELSTRAEWSRIRHHGVLDRVAVARMLGASRAGLVLYHPLPNHLEAQPNKLFEYMAAGLPVIGSDFPLWREIIEGADCGLVVDPMDGRAIGRAMEWVLDHPEEARAMGQRGQRAVREMYNWESEAEGLVELYEHVAGVTR